MARVEIPAPGDLVMDEEGNVRDNETVTLTLAGTVTAATHYSALVGGTSATGGLKSAADGTVVDGSGNRRYVDSGVPMDMTILGRTKQLEPVSASDVAVIKAAPLNPQHFGAPTDGTTSAQAAFDALLASIPATGSQSTDKVPILIDRTYVIDSLNLDSRHNVHLEGKGGVYGGAALLSNKTGSGAIISAASASGFRADGFLLQSGSAAHTGPVIDLSTPNDTGIIDPFKATIHDLRIFMIAQAGASNVGIKTKNGHSHHFSDLYVTGGKAAIQGRDAVTNPDASVQFSNAITVDGRCVFQGQDVAAILNPYNMKLDGCVFEALRDGSAGAVLCEAGIPALALAILDPWCGDATMFGTGTWFHVHGTNIIFGRGGLVESGDTALKLRSGETTKGLHLLGGTYLNGLNKGIDWNSIAVNGGSVLPFTWGTVTTKHANFSSLGTPSLYMDDDVVHTRRDANNMAMSHGIYFNNSREFIQQQMTSTTSVTHRSRITSDTQDRMQINASGTITRGPGGSTAPDVVDMVGTGSPEGVVTSNVGGTFRRRDGGAGTSFYVKESGTGNTGWVAK